MKGSATDQVVSENYRSRDESPIVKDAGFDGEAMASRGTSSPKRRRSPYI